MFTEIDFQNLLFNPLCKKPICDKYPALFEIIDEKYFHEPDLDSILRYIIMVYDSSSVLVLSEKDINYRKGLAADLANLNEDEKYRSDVFDFNNEMVLEISMRYLMRFVRSKAWAAIVAVEFKFWESIRKLLTPIKETSANAELQAVQKKAVISEEVDKDIDRLDKYYKQFFGDDQLFKVVKEKRWTPEHVGKLNK